MFSFLICVSSAAIITPFYSNILDIGKITNIVYAPAPSPNPGTIDVHPVPLPVPHRIPLPNVTIDVHPVPLPVPHRIPLPNPCLSPTTVPLGCHSLKISFEGTGKGVVLLNNDKKCSSDSGIDCGSFYKPETAVTVSATPDVDSSIGVWGGDCTQPPAPRGIDPTFVPPPLSVSLNLDKDKICIVKFDAKPRLTVQIAGDGFGMVRNLPGDINCATGNRGKCTFAVEPMSGTIVKLNYLAAPRSVFGGISGDCSDINLSILIDKNKTCTVTFNLISGVAPPHGVVHSISPEAVQLLNSFYTKDFVFAGFPISADVGIPGHSHYQLLRTNDGPYINSIEIESEPDGSFCGHAAVIPEKSPYWYDTFDAIEQGFDIWYGRFDFSAHREWAGDKRTLGDVWNSNWNPSNWANTFGSFNENGNPFPAGRGPAPHWLEACANSYGNFPVFYEPLPLSDPARFCNYKTVSKLGSHLEWCRVDPPIDFGNINSLLSPLQPWVSHIATGVVTQGVRAGDDYGSSHGDPGDLAPNYWLGIMLPGQTRPYWDSPNGCGTFHAEHDLCSDFQNGIWPDRESISLLSGSPHPNYAKNVWTEIEQWLVPQGYRPDPGDRITVAGRWIIDGGHDDFHTELHPIEAETSTFLQTGPLQRYEPPESFNPPKASVPTVADLPAIITTNQLTMINLPFITDKWSEFTHGNPATVTKLVVTSDWQGNALSFNVYPPPRPSAEAKMHWEREGGIKEGAGVNVLYSAEPADNPNHLVITIPNANLAPLHTNPSYGQIFPDPNRRIVNAYMLWWENQ